MGAHFEQRHITYQAGTINTHYPKNACLFEGSRSFSLTNSIRWVSKHPIGSCGTTGPSFSTPNFGSGRMYLSLPLWFLRTLRKASLQGTVTDCSVAFLARNKKREPRTSSLFGVNRRTRQYYDGATSREADQSIHSRNVGHSTKLTIHWESL